MGRVARQLRLIHLRVRDPDVAAQLERLIAADEQRDDRFDRGLPEFTMAAAEGRDLESMLGRRMGAWRIEGVLGHGGMGAVYQAQRADGHFEQQCALKVVRVDMAHPGARERFLEERQFLAHLSHPNIASLIDGGVENDLVPWFAMELIHGVPIDEWCAQQKLDVRSRIKLMLGVLDAVRFAHRQLVIHRDLKPSNLLVTAEGKVKLLDFGVSTLISNQHHDEGRGRIFGTPRYAAPEQLRPGPISIGVDIYALGLMFHLLLCGRHARGNVARPASYGGNLEPESVGKHMSRAARGLSAAEAVAWSTRPRALARVLHGDLNAIVAHCLEHEPSRRYTTVDALKRDLTAWLDRRPVRARSRSWPYFAERFLTRNRWPVLVLALVLVVGVVAATSAWRNEAIIRKDSEQVHQMLGVYNDVLSRADTFDYGNRTFTVKDAADRSSARILSDTSLDASSRSRMLLSVGRIYFGLGLIANAHEVLSRAVTIAPPGSTDEAAALLDLAIMTYNQGKAVQALDMLTRASTLADTLPPDSLNDLVAAKILSRKILLQVIVRKVPPSTYIDDVHRVLDLLDRDPDDFAGEVITTRVNTAEMLIAFSERLDLASEQLTVAMNAAARHGLEHSTAALTAEALQASIYLRTGKLDLALPFFEAAIRDWKATYPNAPRLVDTSIKYADALERSGMFGRAVTASRDALRVQDELLQSHPERGLCRPMCAEVRLAHALQMSGDPSNSSALLRPFIDKLDTPNGPRNDVDVILASALTMLARNELYTGDATRASDLLRKADTVLAPMAATRNDVIVVKGAIHEARADTCLVAADFDCTVREGELAATALTAGTYDGAQTSSQPADLLLQRTIAVAMLARADTAPAGRSRLNTAATLALAQYGGCSPITRAMQNQRPVLSWLAVRKASMTACRSSGTHAAASSSK
jgi:serine/threonine-protein kinase